MLFYEMKKGFLQKKLAIERFITFYFRFLQEINIISPMRKLIVFFSFWFSVTIVVAQNTERKLYSIAFYNLENLFDTIHDAGKNDYDFLPDGSYRWTAKKYEAKLHKPKIIGWSSGDDFSFYKFCRSFINGFVCFVFGIF